MKRKIADEPDLPVKQLYNRSLRELGTVAVDDIDEVAGHFPHFHQIKSSLYRERRKFQPPLPQTRRDIVIAPPFSETSDGRRFLLANDGDDDKILVFGTEENLVRMCRAEKVFMDGTFWISPKLFTQMYSLHVSQYDVMSPVIYALLPNKTRNTYERLFQILKRVCERQGLTFNPPEFSVDFEQACLQAVNSEFPDAVVAGCLFHFSQSVWRKVQDVRLVVAYKEQPEVRQFVRRLCALAFVPLDRLDDAWLEVTAVAPNDNRVEELTDYFVRTWFEDVGARFSRRTWNQHDRMDAASSRTNNHVESFHSAFNKRSNGAHPNIYKLCALLRDHQTQTEGTLRLRRAGQPLQVRRQRYQTAARRLERLHHEFEQNQRGLLDYIDACSAVIKLGD